MGDGGRSQAGAGLGTIGLIAGSQQRGQVPARARADLYHPRARGEGGRIVSCDRTRRRFVARGQTSCFGLVAGKGLGIHARLRTGFVRRIPGSLRTEGPGRLFSLCVHAKRVLSCGERLLQAAPDSVRSFASSVAPVLLPEPVFNLPEELGCPFVVLVLAD